MAYILSSASNTNHLLTYDHEGSEDYRSFFRGEPLLGCGKIGFRINKNSHVRAISKTHVIASTGPTLFSRPLRELIERVAPGEAEFFDAALSLEGRVIEGLSAINPLSKIACVDLEKSEFKITNFDPRHPEYMFYYQVLLDEIPSGVQIATCKEHHRQIIVGQAIRDDCRASGLEGLRFCRSIDMTPQNRSICE